MLAKSKYNSYKYTSGRGRGIIRSVIILHNKKIGNTYTYGEGGENIKNKMGSTKTISN